MILRKINEQGLFVEDVILGAIPTIKQIQVIDDVEVEMEVNDPHYIQEIPVGFYLPKWDGEKWVEGLTQAQIDELNNRPIIPTTEDKVQQLQEENINLMLASAETYEVMYQENVNLMLAVAELYETVMTGGAV